MLCCDCKVCTLSVSTSSMSDTRGLLKGKERMICGLDWVLVWARKEISPFCDCYWLLGFSPSSESLGHWPQLILWGFGSGVLMLLPVLRKLRGCQLLDLAIPLMVLPTLDLGSGIFPFCRTGQDSGEFFCSMKHGPFLRVF